MSSGNTVFGESFYRNTWALIQKPENKQIIEALEGEKQIDEEDVLARVELSEDEFYGAVEKLEEAGILHHYDQKHSRGHRTTEMSLYSVIYPAETALEFNHQEEYVQRMLEQDEEMLNIYESESE